MSNRLKIYACSGIGDVEAQEQFNYWTDNTNTLSNTQAVNTLLALINRNYIEVTRLRSMTPEQKIANLNDIDVYTVCLAAAQRYKDNNKELEHAGVVIGMMMADGDFNYQSLNNSERDAHLDHLLDKANDLFTENKIDHTDASFVQWFNETVVARNKVGLSQDEQQRIEESLEKAVAGIGANDAWMKNKELSNFLLKGSEYFLYTYFTNEQFSKLPKVFKDKAKKQRRIYNYCKSMFVGIYGNENEMQEIIRSGIIDYFEATPEQVCQDIVDGKKQISGIGITPEMIAAIVIAVLAIVVAAIVEIIKAQAARDGQKYAGVDEELINQSVPNKDDWDGLKLPGKSLSSTGILLALAGIAAFFVIKKKKNR